MIKKKFLKRALFLKQQFAELLNKIPRTCKDGKRHKY